VDVEEAVVAITVGDADITADVIFAETTFQVVAAAQPGSCQIAVRGLHSFAPGKDLIALWINGKRMWWGYLFVLEQGYVFPDSPQAKMTLHGVDLNILFDKLVLYNRFRPRWYPDGGYAVDGTGAYRREKVTQDGKVTGYLVTVPPHTTDRQYIRKMLRDFDIDKVSPLIRWGQPPLAPNDCKIFETAEINTGDTGNTWTPPSAGTTMRAFFQDVSANIVRSQPGSAVWYIDPDGYIVWRDQDYEAAPFNVGDNAGYVACKNLSITTDISRLKNDVLIFTGTLDPTPTSTQEFLKFIHETNDGSVNLYGRFQWSEVMGSDWMPGMIKARADKVLNQEGLPAMRAEFTVYKAGLYPGQLITIASGVHTFTIYDPALGLQTTNSVFLPIRAIDMKFPTPHTVEYRATCSYDTQDPWGLLLALKRPASRGFVQPNFNVIDRSKTPVPGQEYEFITASGMILVKEWPERRSGGLWKCTYAYIRGSLTVVVSGLRRTSIPDPEGLTGGVAGYLETDPDNGIFFTDATITDNVYVEYHVWHNLDVEAV